MEYIGVCNPLTNLLLTSWDIQVYSGVETIWHTPLGFYSRIWLLATASYTFKSQHWTGWQVAISYIVSVFFSHKGDFVSSI